MTAPTSERIGQTSDTVTGMEIPGFRGEVIVAEHAAYDDARAVWNGTVDRRPRLIARCTGAADVASAVCFARDRDLEIAVRGGGHNVAGTAVCDDGIVIDLSAMRAVWVDPARGTAQVQGGALWGDVDHETQVHGLATTGGIVSHTGVGGVSLGGGIGWLMRKHGLTVDNLVEAEVVTAEGDIVRASAHAHPDLFWALRGGGGNFGIVTSFEYRLHPVTQVLGGLVIYPLDQAREVLRFYRDFCPGLPDDAEAYSGLLTSPEGVPVVALIVPTLLLAQDKSTVLANCKLKAMELYRPSGELSQDTRASEYVVTCMTSWGYRIDPTKEFACYGWPTIAECFIPR